jgi:hypothetical protein
MGIELDAHFAATAAAMVFMSRRANGAARRMPHVTALFGRSDLFVAVSLRIEDGLCS